VWLCGEVWRLKKGQRRGGVLKEDTPEVPKIINGKGILGVSKETHHLLDFINMTIMHHWEEVR
jgi:hypothetical protein